MRTTIKTILLIAVLAMLAASCSTGGTDETAAAEKAAATQQANIDAVFAQDLDATMATYTEDVEFFNAVMGSHWSGKTAYRSNIETIFEITDPDATELIDNFVSDDGTRGVIVMHWVGENGAGNPIDLTYVQLQEFEDGLIDKTTMYWDDQDVADQLGAGY